MESLPQEIAVNILSRLPITTLINVKLVCRSWRNLVQDPLVGRMMLSYTATKNPCLILHSNNPTRNALYAVDFSADGENIEAVKNIRVPAFPEFHVTASCNGLLCLCDSLFSSRIYVYNPFTMDVAELPESMRHINQQVVVGFGFSSRDGDYKVVRIVGSYGPIARSSSVDILSLSNLTWKSLGETPCQIFDRPAQALVNERLHWPTWPINRNSSARLLLSFDLSDEQFREVPKPECGSLDQFNHHLLVLGGCLSASVYSGAGFFEIWVMKEYGVKESWIKEYAIDIPDQTFNNSGLRLARSYATVICLLKNEKILLDMIGSRDLVTFDTKSGTFSHLTFDGLPRGCETIGHVGSLLWIDS